ncbi:hypothetical protein T06_10372 [Trichinella sp. T6]|nr:hypothetical protein T06_10372 [Trichinella sp. T6]
MPNVAAKPKAKLTVRNMPWEPPLNTSWATAPQPNITRMRVPRHSARAWRNSMLRIWKNRDSLSNITFCLPMISCWRLMSL